MIENSKRNHTFLLHASWLMHTSILDGAVCTTITHPDLLLSQGRTQWVECHYGHAQVDDTNSDHPNLRIFCYRRCNFY